MKVKTSELTGAALDWAVAKCEGYAPKDERGWAIWRHVRGVGSQHRYSTDWADGGPIIEREWLDITPWPNESREDMRWHCQQHDSSGDCAQYGETPLIAAMRCYVASKLGDEVDVPDELTREVSL